jgi:hypothetical protein
MHVITHGIIFYFTENVTGLEEVRRIEVHVTDLNNIENCQETEDDCELEKIFYFIYGECIELIT